MPGFDDHVISMYARGMSVREIQGHLLELYGTEVSPDLISTITDEVLEEVTQWQQRPLEAMYPIVYFDALRLKIRDEGTVKNKAVYLALGIRADGRKEVLGLWIEQTEGAKFWLKVFNELKNRGLDDILIAVVDGLRWLKQHSTRLRPAHGHQIPDRGGDVATPVAAGDSVLCVPAGGAHNHLHDKCHREPAYAPA